MILVAVSRSRNSVYTRRRRRRRRRWGVDETHRLSTANVRRSCCRGCTFDLAFELVSQQRFEFRVRVPLRLLLWQRFLAAFPRLLRFAPLSRH